MSWQAPEGYVLTEHPGYYVNIRGFRVDDVNPTDRALMPDGTIEVLWWNEDEPFVWKVNDGSGANASQEAKDAAAAGTPLAGYSPNTTTRPIKDGWVPPTYQLHSAEEAP